MPDLSDAFAMIRELQAEVRRLRSGIPLENSSVTNGRLRFIGGTLRVDSGGHVEIVGTLEIDGTTTVTGQFTVEGPWSLDGNGNITGDVTISGTVDLTGDMNVTGDIVILPGGKITVGTITIDPTISGGAVAFQNGAQVFTDASTIQVYKGNGVVQISDTEAKLQLGGTALRLTSGHILVAGMATKAVGTVPGGFVGAIVYDAGEWKRLI